MKIAIMGCVVNGPGEAKEADFELLEDEILLFTLKKEKLLKIKPEEAIDVLKQAIDNFKD